MNYVMSDIHGHYEKYLRMLEQINFTDSDHLYILGDLIDKGEDSGCLLLDVLSDKRVTCMIGNHELMMIRSTESEHNMRLWRMNGADDTIKQIENAGCSYIDLIPEIKKMPVVIPDLALGDRHFYLCHAAPLTNAPSRQKKILFMHDLSEAELFDVVWDRTYKFAGANNDLFYKMYDRTYFLFGHTPTYHCRYQRNDENGRPMMSVYPDGKKRFINIDCGCAGNRRLGCVRLEDFEEFYT